MVGEGPLTLDMEKDTIIKEHSTKIQIDRKEGKKERREEGRKN